MPYKNTEDKRAAGRRHYAAHRKEVIARVKTRKWTLYAGKCEVCGAQTMGSSKGKAASRCPTHKNRQPYSRKDRT